MENETQETVGALAQRGIAATVGALDVSQDLQMLGTPGELASLWGAMAQAQGELPVIPKSKTVRIRKKAGGEYTYDYAPLADMVRLCKPALTKHGLSILQPMTLGDAGGVIWTILAHKSGAAIVSCCRFRPNADIKDMGGQTTYLARYAYQRLLGIDGDADADAHPRDGEGTATVVDKAPKRPTKHVRADVAKAATGGKAAPLPDPTCPKAILEAINAARKEAGMSGAQVSRLSKEGYGHPPRMLPEADARNLLGQIQEIALDRKNQEGGQE